MNQFRLRSTLAAGVVLATAFGALGVVSASGRADDPAPVDVTREKVVRWTGRTVSSTETAEQQVAVTAATAGEFTAITPYRAFDSRVNWGDKFRFGDDFVIEVWSDQFGNPVIPNSAIAVAFNVTVVETESTFGFLTVFNGDAPTVPLTSTINWVLPNFTIANGGIVALGPSGGFVGTVGVVMDGAPEAAAHVIIDVTGYYSP